MYKQILTQAQMVHGLLLLAMMSPVRLSGMQTCRRTAFMQFCTLAPSLIDARVKESKKKKTFALSVRVTK